MNLHYTCLHSGKCQQNCQARGLFKEKMKFNCGNFKIVDVIDVKNLLKADKVSKAEKADDKCEKEDAKEIDKED